MSNRVINIGSTKKEEEQTSNLPTYTDIDMISQYNNNGNRENRFKVHKSIDVQAVQNSINNIFSWVPGERIINPEFGSRLREMLYEGITEYTQQKIYAEIKNALNQWEPRVTLVNINNSSSQQDIENNTIVLDIEYSINGLQGKTFVKRYTYNRYGQ